MLLLPTSLPGTFYVFLLLVLLCLPISWKQFSLFTNVFGISWTITDSKKLHSLKTSPESFWVILGIILVLFLNLLRAFKPFLIKVCKDVFCITPMLTGIKKLFTASPLLLETILWYFLVCFVVFFSISWQPFSFSWNFAHILLIILWWLSD